MLVCLGIRDSVEIASLTLSQRVGQEAAVGRMCGPRFSV